MGGIVMIPLLLVILAALTLVIERFFCLQKYSAQTRLIDPVLESLGDGNFSQATSLLKGQEGPVIWILKSGIDHFHANEDVLDNAIKRAFYEDAANLQKYLTTIQVLGAIMPMLGLLGTINGMVHIFGAVSQLGMGDAQSLAKGISEALITTETGIAGAIPVIFLHNYLANTVDRIMLELKRAATGIHHLARLRNASGQGL